MTLVVFNRSRSAATVRLTETVTDESSCLPPAESTVHSISPMP